MTSHKLNQVSIYFGCLILLCTTACFAWEAPNQHPMWWYHTLRGLVICSCAVFLSISYTGRGSWYLFAVIAAGMIGIYLFGNFEKEQWTPINRLTSVAMVIAAILPLSTLLSLPANWKMHDAELLKQAEIDCFPYRPMSDCEATEIYVGCLHLMQMDYQPRSLTIPSSRLPRGGFPAIVEAFARYYVANYPSGNADALEHFKSGVAIFAGSAPDWIVDAHPRRLGPKCDSGQLHACELALSLNVAITDSQMNWGASTFETRIQELQLELHGRAEKRSEKGVHPTKAYCVLRKGGHAGPICCNFKDFRRENPACPQVCCTTRSAYVTTGT